MHLARLAIALISFLLAPLRGLWAAALQPVWRSRHERDLIRSGLATRYRGRLIPVMRGGDPRTDPLFPQVPQDLKTVDDDEQLAALRDELANRIRDVAAGRRDPEIVGDRTEVQVADEMASAVAALDLVKAELAARTSEAEAYDQRIAELAAEAGVDATTAEAEELAADTDDDEETAEETETETHTEAVAAAATLGRRPLPAARRHKPTPQEHDTRGLRVTSHAAGRGAPYDAQTALDRRMVGDLLAEMVNKRIRPGERAVIASATFDYPDERKLDTRAGEENTEKIQAELSRINRDVFSPKALLASGANCAPLTPIYDLPGVESAVRPARDALASFQAARGGVQVGATPVLGDFAAAVDVVTAADNALGGTHAVKSCLRIECPEFSSVQVDAIYACYEMDNLGGRAYPELMARVDELLRAEQARLADSRILTTISSAAAGATKLTGGFLTPGAVSAFMGDVYKAAAQYRSSNRMSPDATLQAFFPFWVVDLLALDFVRGQFDREKTRADIETLLRSANITPVFHLDGSSTATVGQVFARATAGALASFPSRVEWQLFAPGTWLHLDSGQLDLGVVRDSTLNSTNDFQVFYETWENVVKVGGDAYSITTQVCANGQVTVPAAAPAC